MYYNMYLQCITGFVTNKQMLLTFQLNYWNHNLYNHNILSHKFYMINTTKSVIISHNIMNTLHFARV